MRTNSASAAQDHPDLTPEQVKMLTEDIPKALVEETHDPWTGEPKPAATTGQRIRMSDGSSYVVIGQHDCVCALFARSLFVLVRNACGLRRLLFSAHVVVVEEE